MIFFERREMSFLERRRDKARAVVCESQTGCLEVVNKGFMGRKQGGNVC